ncbi:MAG: SRPBCC family protein [Thermoleophilia bacterium]
MSLTVTVVVPADAETTWRHWTDFAAWPQWNPNCVEATVDGPLAEGTRLDLRLRHPGGRDFYTRPRLVEVQPAHSVAWQARSLGLRATTRTLLESEHDGTRVTITADAVGPLALPYKLAVTDRTQALIYVAMLDALTDRLRA